MGFNGTGTYVITTPGTPFQTRQPADAAVMNDVLGEVATGLSLAICRDGQSTVTANLSIGNHRLLDVAKALSLTDGATVENLIANTGRWIPAGSVFTGGGGNTITLSPSPAPVALTAGTEFWFVATLANTGAVTVTITGFPIKNLTKLGTTALTSNNIRNGAIIGIMYDGTQFQLISPIG